MAVADEVAPGHADHQARGGHAPVVGAQHGGAQPVERYRQAAAVSLVMTGGRAALQRAVRAHPAVMSRVAIA